MQHNVTKRCKKITWISNGKSKKIKTLLYAKFYVDKEYKKLIHH